jgi:predicted amidohydrolase YtcJ
MIPSNTISAMFLLFTFFIINGCSGGRDFEAADLVIHNAKIFTVNDENPQATAVAVKDEVIIAVGDDKLISKYIDKEKTKVIDAAGRLVVPGFNDAHAHFGPVNIDYIELRYTTDPAIITEKVKEKVAEVKPGQLIRGGHWEHEMFIDKKWPAKELIDPVSPDNPVILSRTDGHSMLVNSYVLKASGITKDTPDPYGGEIQRDPETGELTGILKETAQGLVKTGAIETVYSEEEKNRRRENGWDAAFDMAASDGVTSIQMPGGGDAEYMKKRKEAGKLTLRIDVAGYITDDIKKLQEYDNLRKEYPREKNWIRFGYVKGFIDGTLGSATALFFEPFEDEPETSGLSQMPYDELEKKVLLCDSMGFQIGIHAIGSKGNNWVLNAYEKAREVNGRANSRHRIEHAQILIEEDIQRFAELGVIASMQPTHCITDKRFCEKRIGRERSKFAYPWKSLLNAGTKIAFGTDYSVEPLNPMEGLYAAVTRKDRMGEEGDGWFPGEKLSMDEAIRLYTLGSAYAQFMEDRKGIIKEGYLADMVILDHDLFNISEDEIMKTKVDYTIVGGKIIFKR